MVFGFVLELVVECLILVVFDELGFLLVGFGVWSFKIFIGYFDVKIEFLFFIFCVLWVCVCILLCENFIYCFI